MYFATLKNAILATSLSLNALAGVYFYNCQEIGFDTNKDEIKQSSQVVNQLADNKESVNSAPTTSIDNSKSQYVKPKVNSKKRKFTKLKVSHPIPVEAHPINISEDVVAYQEAPQPVETVMTVTHYSIPAETISIQNNDTILESSETQTTSFIGETITSDSMDQTQIMSSIEETHSDIVPTEAKSEIDDQQHLSVKLNLLDPTNLKVVWADNTGKIVNISNSTYPKGIQKINIKTEEIHPGIYTINLLNASSNETLKSIRFVK